MENSSACLPYVIVIVSLAIQQLTHRSNGGSNCGRRGAKASRCVKTEVFPQFVRCYQEVE